MVEVVGIEVVFEYGVYFVVLVGVVGVVEIVDVVVVVWCKEVVGIFIGGVLWCVEVVVGEGYVVVDYGVVVIG